MTKQGNLLHDEIWGSNLFYFIANQLALSDWNIKNPTQVIEEFDVLTALPEGITDPRMPYDGHQFSDYTLLSKDGKPMAVVEAKKSSKAATIGFEQAKYYCYKILRYKNRYQQSLIKLETLYGALSQLALKDELDLSCIPLPETGALENTQEEIIHEGNERHEMEQA